jgi:demethoxyubiquinone hydroxylase (CLK1/Coq7/Cat5 family)
VVAVATVSAASRHALIRFLRREHANERAAARAYHGHAASVSDPEERAKIAQIEAEEWHHRARLAVFLAELGSGPSPAYEAVIGAIGATLGWMCHVTGWLLPMIGAGFLERANSHGYAVAADHAVAAGLPAMAAELRQLERAEIEHHAWFSARIATHWLGRRLPLRPPHPWSGAG